VSLDLRALEELHAPLLAQASDEVVELVAGPRTDLFCPPGGDAATLNAPALLADLAKGDFALSARVEAELRSTFDAGALLLWHDESTWAKLAVERSPDGRPTVVSVVTRGASDDCNSIALERPGAQLRAARIGDAFAFHVHLEDRWQLIRHFSLGTAGIRPGFLAQSPTGEGCATRFTGIRVEARRLADLRDGT
jgi:regulation of enolase protein 1 (concanavalin A-like superfamily)